MVQMLEKVINKAKEICSKDSHVKEAATTTAPWYAKLEVNSRGETQLMEVKVSINNGFEMIVLTPRTMFTETDTGYRKETYILRQYADWNDFIQNC